MHRHFETTKPFHLILCDMATEISQAPLVGVVMGSKSDWETMRHASELLTELGIPHESKVVSAHRTPERLFAMAARPRLAVSRF